MININYVDAYKEVSAVRVHVYVKLSTNVKYCLRDALQFLSL